MTILDIFMLCGGLGMFLYGMNLMGEGFEKTAGDRLRAWLHLLTNKRIVGVLVGLGVTGIIQSSSATTVMLVGFVNAGVMTLTQAMGVIMGASIGTTVTGLIVAFKLTAIAPLLILIGFIMQYYVKKIQAKHLGLIILGLGILFLGMDLMGGSLKPLAESELFRNIIISMKNPLLGLLVGTLITAVIQSSSAFTGILITLALQGLITLESAIPLVMGSNIGTCIAALLACIGTNYAAKRTSLVHLIYKIAGAVLFMVIYAVLPISSWIKNAVADPSWQVALFNTIYNVTYCVLLYPFADWFIKITERIIPVDKETEADDQSLIYFTEATLSTPTLAIPQMLKEVQRMIDLSKKNLLLALESFKNESGENLDRLMKREKIINYLNQELTKQLVRVSDLDLSWHDRRILIELLHIIPDVERIGDHAQNIAEYSQIAEQNKLIFSEASKTGAAEMGEAVLKTLSICTEAYFNRDESLYAAAFDAEELVDLMRARLINEHIDRLNAGLCSPQSSMIYTDYLGDLERVSDHAINFIAAMENSAASR